MNTNEEIKNLKQAVQKLAKEFAQHTDGDGTNPHMLATDLTNGLMSADDFKVAHGYAHKDNYLGDKYSFWDIPFGTYATVYAWHDLIPMPDVPTNTPGDLITLKVWGEDNRRKCYLMIVQKNGGIWYLNTSNNQGNGGGNNNSLVWKNIPQRTSLWKKGDGTPCSVGQNMNFPVSTRRFGSLIFTIDFLGTMFRVQVPAVDNPQVMFSAVAGTINESYSVRLNFEMVRDNVVLKYKQCRLVTFKADGSITFSEDTGPKILGVEGEY